MHCGIDQAVRGKTSAALLIIPPCFHQKLSRSISEPIVMKIGFYQIPRFEDIAKEVIDIYLQ